MIMKKPYPFRGELQLGVTHLAEREYTHFQQLQAAAFRDRRTIATPSRPVGHSLRVLRYWPDCTGTESALYTVLASFGRRWKCR